MAIIVNAPEAVAKFAEILSQVQLGEEVVIIDAGIPVARIVAVSPQSYSRIPGLDKGQVTIAPDFNDPLPPDIINDFLGASDLS